MARSAQNTTAPWLLPLIIAVLVMTSLLPARFSTPWVSKVSAQTVVVFAPLSQTFNSLGQLFTPPKHSPSDMDPESAARIIEDLQTRNLQHEREILRLRAELDLLSRGGGILPQTPVRIFRRPVISPGGKLMRIRGGANEGITRSTIVTAGHNQLVGRVEDIESRFSIVQPITAVNAPLLNARILESPDRTDGLRCQLTPMGDGTFQGDTGILEPGSTGITVGQTVVLDDDQWPDHAQMYVIGIVESVEDFPTTDTKKIVTVRPTVAVRRVAEVYFRVPIDTSSDNGSGNGPDSSSGGTP